jgi:hypothetical protein
VTVLGGTASWVGGGGAGLLHGTATLSPFLPGLSRFVALSADRLVTFVARVPFEPFVPFRLRTPSVAASLRFARVVAAIR